MFDTNIVRIFSFWREGNLTDEILEEILQRFEVPIKRAEEENIILALENEHECSIGSGEESRRFLDRISSKNVGLIWDPGNAHFLGEVPYPDGYELIKDRIVHVHIKDAGKDKKGKPIWLPVGKGEIDFKGQLRALNENNFSGVVSLETHYIPQGGSQEEGTRESFSGMKSILQSLRIKAI
jgi:sugar phosphate isomerase/epimerase